MRLPCHARRRSLGLRIAALALLALGALTVGVGLVALFHPDPPAGALLVLLFVLVVAIAGLIDTVRLALGDADIWVDRAGGPRLATWIGAIDGRTVLREHPRPHPLQVATPWQ
ncbi:hypothetical protein [Brachybacterium squillarum]|uniref:hypothetical protein n=1 Tax=Brachybacterium squillarum TaxID=661979 RepID=UPI000262981B|nr:hypothetical protein [Brachybacterium squillarum]